MLWHDSAAVHTKHRYYGMILELYTRNTLWHDSAAVHTKQILWHDSQLYTRNAYYGMILQLYTRNTDIMA